MTGFARIIDIAALKSIWPVIGKAFSRSQSGNRQQRRASGKTGEDGPELNTVEMLEAVTKLPHALELHFATERGMSWSTLKPSSMLSSADDVALKHGDALPGEWRLLGIVDARPNEDVASAWDDQPQTPLSSLVANLLRHVRDIMGRPVDAYGVTPLLLFRVVRPA